MKKFKVVIKDMELAHYESIYEIEAKNEEGARQIALEGSHPTIDVQTIEYTVFNQSVAEYYIDNDSKFIEIEVTVIDDKKEKQRKTLKMKKEELLNELKIVNEKLKL